MLLVGALFPKGFTITAPVELYTGLPPGAPIEVVPVPPVHPLKLYCSKAIFGQPKLIGLFGSK